ncbi:DUF5320 domain-containing protein [uncultured Desulfuromonas sp.]|uniref:DUF5320 domain-containing protein n=1 Tax=uncultured Desulfuromonas sp. TaxID=181013 RepID=UPI002AABFF96|nr:DUF5320 domain-containing protein [uncultured Desulfuromonas sp.]
MPNQNGTGPLGDGPMTGRGAGRCGRGQRNGGAGRGMGRQQMMRQGIRRLDNTNDTALRQQMDEMQQQLNTMSKSLEELGRQRN